MKNISFCIIVFLTGVQMTMAQAENKLVLHDTSGSQSYSLNEVRKITFTDDALVVNLNNGADQHVRFDELRYFSFLDATPVLEIAATQAKLFWSEASGEVKAVSDSRIKQIEIIDMQGRRALSATPESREANIDFSAWPRGLYIVRMIDETGVTIRKFVK
jgi:hypothetical protein